MRRIEKRIYKLLLISASIFLLVGCQSINSRLGKDAADYSCAKEMPALKFPTNALTVSKRYDIPEIPNNNYPLIKNNAPPDFLKE